MNSNKNYTKGQNGTPKRIKYDLNKKYWLINYPKILLAIYCVYISSFVLQKY
jgi:hypothetical protein